MSKIEQVSDNLIKKIGVMSLNISKKEIISHINFKINQYLDEEQAPEAFTYNFIHAVAHGFNTCYGSSKIDFIKLQNDIQKHFNLPSNKELKKFFQQVFDIKEHKKNKYTFIDLFAGIGGFRLALEALEHTCVFSSEIDPYAQLSYLENFTDLPFGDIKKIKEDHLPDFDILCAGFPCQPFSYAGKKEGFEDEARGTLFFDIYRILKAKKPKMFLLENVKGLISHDNGNTLITILELLGKLGYKLHWKILNSHKFGVPQKRERWYCVGFDKDVDFEFPIGDKPNSTLRDIIDFNNNDSTLRLTEFEQNRIRFHFENDKGSTRVKHDNSTYGAETKKGKYGVYSFLKPDRSLRFHVGDVAKTQIQEAFYSSLDTYASTIIANRVPKLWDINRYLSVQEALKLQGFPIDYIFPVSKNQAYKQLGNSITIPVVQAIAEKMILCYSQKT